MNVHLALFKTPGLLKSDNVNKPVVKQLFERYDVDNKGKMTAIKLQVLCYEVIGVYMTLKELELSILSVVSSVGGVSSRRCKLTYDQFMVWYRSNNKLRYFTFIIIILYLVH